MSILTNIFNLIDEAMMVPPMAPNMQPVRITPAISNAVMSGRKLNFNQYKTAQMVGMVPGNPMMLPRTVEMKMYRQFNQNRR